MLKSPLASQNFLHPTLISHLLFLTVLIKTYIIMSDFFIWMLVIALSCAKLILFALLIVAVWVWIKKNSPATAEEIEKRIPKYKRESK